MKRIDIKRFERICIVGVAGSGKSTLARWLGKACSISVYHLDRLYWRRGWQKAPKGEFLNDVEKIVEGKSWVIDGNYRHALDMRFSKSVREDMAERCPEKFDLKFLKWILRFRKNEKPILEEKIYEYESTNVILRFKNRKELRAYFSTL